MFQEMRTERFRKDQSIMAGAHKKPKLAVIVESKKLEEVTGCFRI